ncbi:MAG TPA: hypothetical protein VFJ61_00165 [Solirubrobacterales bacterium]|nr:hypothetical protein [Solirubrobacterales bacterium]
MPRLPAIAIALLLGAFLVGCGEGGAANGAEVTVYVSAPLRGPEGAASRRLCDEARAQASQQGSGGEDLRLRVVCLDAGGGGRSWTLAQVGANARQATEDSTAIAYVGEPNPQARRQSRPIVAAAGIAEIGGLSGEEAVARIVAALRDGDEREPRQAVFEAEG